MTSKHDGFEEFRDLEPEHSEEVDQTVYEGIVQHACETAIEEMVNTGQLNELFKMFAEVIPKIQKKEFNDSAREGNNVTPVQG
ncbi:hypothetical protein CL629_02810 [bacterium]|nr:hypothetical protein [bacterium]